MSLRTALWILQITHQPKLYPDISGQHVPFADNLNTHRTLAMDLTHVTYELMNVDSTIWKQLSKAIIMVTKASGDLIELGQCL